MMQKLSLNGTDAAHFSSSPPEGMAVLDRAYSGGDPDLVKYLVRAGARSLGDS
jgi:hypothetical protein